MTFAGKPLLTAGARVRLNDGAVGTMTREGKFWRFDGTFESSSWRTYFTDDTIASMIQGRRIQLLEEPPSPTEDTAPDAAAETVRAPSTRRRGRR